MKNIILLLALSLAGCSSSPVRKTEEMTRWKAPEMRIAIYSPRLDGMATAQVQDALQSTGRFWIVSRGQGLEAIFAEQNMTHRDQLDRFEGKEKWAHWGKIHGVGAVILAQDTCSRVSSWGGQIFMRCQQSLSMLDATTGELIASAIETVDGGYDQLSPDWTESVNKLVRHIPRVWEEKVFEGRAAERQIASEEHSNVMKKKHAVKAPVGQGE